MSLIDVQRKLLLSENRLYTYLSLKNNNENRNKVDTYFIQRSFRFWVVFHIYPQLRKDYGLFLSYKRMVGITNVRLYCR